MTLARVLAAAAILTSVVVANRAAADDTPKVSCRHDRNRCLEKIALECPGGFVIVEERDGYNPDPALMGHWWRIWYGCAPLPGTAPAVAPPAPVAPLAPGTPPLPVAPPAPVAPPSLEGARQLADIELRIEALRDESRRTASLGKPITLMAVGYAAGGLLLLFGLESLATDEEDFETGERNDVGAARRAGGVLVALSAGGFALGIYGHIVLKRRLRTRRAINDQIDALVQERRALRYRLHYGVDPLSSRLHLRLTF